MKPLLCFTGTQARVALILLLFVLRSAAVDPLPPELENASPAAQAAWWDKLGRDSQRDKIEVGQKRFDQRLAFKQSLMTHVQADAKARRDEILIAQTGFVEVGGSVSPPNGREYGLIALLILIVGALLVRRHMLNAKPID